MVRICRIQPNAQISCNGCYRLVILAEITILTANFSRFFWQISIFKFQFSVRNFQRIIFKILFSVSNFSVKLFQVSAFHLSIFRFSLANSNFQVSVFQIPTFCVCLTKSNFTLLLLDSNFHFSAWQKSNVQISAFQFSAGRKVCFQIVFCLRNFGWLACNVLALQEVWD